MCCVSIGNWVLCKLWQHLLLFLFYSMVVDIVLHFCSNIEDITRDAGSFEVEEDALLRKCRVDTVFYLKCCSYLNVVFTFKRTAEWTRATQSHWWIDLRTIVWNYRGILYIIVSTIKYYYAQCLLLLQSLPYAEYHKLDSSKKKVLSEARLSAPLHKVNNCAWSDYLSFGILDVGPCLLWFLSESSSNFFIPCDHAYALQAVCYF